MSERGIQEAVDLLDRLIVLPPNAPKLDLDAREFDNPKEGGYFRHGRGIREIKINTLSGDNDPVYSLAHEFGHYLDVTLGTRPDTFLSAKWGTGLRGDDFPMLANTPLADLFNAILDSPSFVEILHEASPQEPEDDIWGGLFGTFADYESRPHEVFARAFAQWVVIQGSDPDVLDYIYNERPRILHGYNTPIDTWGEDEFKPIAAAMERFLHDQGMLKIRPGTART